MDRTGETFLSQPELYRFHCDRPHRWRHRVGPTAGWASGVGVDDPESPRGLPLPGQSPQWLSGDVPGAQQSVAPCAHTDRPGHGGFSVRGSASGHVAAAAHPPRWPSATSDRQIFDWSPIYVARGGVLGTDELGYGTSLFRYGRPDRILPDH